jgi:uncharacterized repeat protein (TIGR01451 family)
MIGKIHPLALSVIICFVLASCNPGGSTPTGAAPNIIQSNPSAAQLVTIELTVLADTSTPFNTVGQKIKLNYGIKNTGSTGVTGAITVTGATVTCPGVDTIGNKDNSLDPNEIMGCTSEYTITQADLDKGSVTLLSVASVNGINSNPVTTTVPIVQPRALSLTTTASPLTYDQVGRQITFTYVIKNSGSQSLGPAQFTVSDSLVRSTPIDCGAATTTLAPGATVTCTATYAVTQADLNSVSITNIATASGGGVGPSPSASATITKGVVTPTNASNLAAGSTVQHTVLDGEWLWQIARCYGVDPNKVIAANPQLPNPSQISRGIVLSVPNIGSAGTIYGPPCVVKHTVKSGETWNSIAQLYNADPAILQMANANTMNVGSDVNVPRNSARGTSTVPRALTLTTSANPSTYEQVGQQIAFTYVIRNSGTSNLGPAQFTISDTLISAAPINCGGATTSLAPNATVSCTANYTITQADLNSVSITNIATASGGGVGPSQSASTTVNKGARALTLTTSANPTTYEQAGQQITYTYVIKNSGTTTIGPAQFTVSDSLISPAPFNCGAANTSLASNATVTCNATYTITQADAAAVSVTNIATASGGGVGPTQSASTTINKVAKLLTLTTATNPQTYNQVGQQITFTYVIKNSGNTTLGPAQFTISDSLISPAPFNCGIANTSLAPNAMATCTATYTITQADMAAVSITNIATASGGGAGPSQPASTTVNKQ